MYMYNYTNTYICTHVCIHIYMYTENKTWLNNIYIYIYIYTHMYTHIYIYILTTVKHVLSDWMVLIQKKACKAFLQSFMLVDYLNVLLFSYGNMFYLYAYPLQFLLAPPRPPRLTHAKFSVIKHRILPPHNILTCFHMLSQGLSLF